MFIICLLGRLPLLSATCGCLYNMADQLLCVLRDLRSEDYYIHIRKKVNLDSGKTVSI